MRFDDTLTTVLAQPVDDIGAKTAVWMQIVDILAQDKGTISPELRVEAMARVTDLREAISPEGRRSAAQAVAFQCRSKELVRLFGMDVPMVAAPVLRSAQLSAANWEDVLPALPSPSRALLRERRDLPNAVSQMLAAYGPSDFALPNAHPQMATDAVAQIQDLVARIQAFRKERSEEELDIHLPEPAGDPVDAFRFETGIDGLISWVDGAPRGPIIGIELGAMAEIGEHGVDGHAAGAFRRRTPFRNARMRVPGQGIASGDWLISGLPLFDEATGRFEGYRCTARRPKRTEHPYPRMTGLVSQGLPPDSLRQLVHELRTPLNAIRGFAEMISAQLLGPVSSPYRERAEAIIADARKLLAMFDDLDVAAKIERGVFDGRSVAGVEPVPVLRSIVQEVAPPGSVYRTRFQLELDTAVPAVMLDLVTAERLFSSLLSAVLSATREEETLSVQLHKIGPHVQLRVERPELLHAMSSQQLFDTSFDPGEAGLNGPPLGLGFALRLVDSMAVAVGASFEITEQDFVLRLPIIASNGAAENGS